MPVDTHGPYAKDYGMPPCHISERDRGARCLGLGRFMEPLMALNANVRVTMAQVLQSVHWGLPSTSATEQPGKSRLLPHVTLTYHIKAFCSATAYVEPLRSRL